MKCIVRYCKRGFAAILSLGMILSGVPAGISFAAQSISTVYAAAYQDASSTADTTLPAAINVEGQSTAVTWSWSDDTFLVPYDTVEVTGTTEDGDTVTAQVEVIPSVENELVYYIDAGRDTGKESTAYTSVQGLATAALLNDVADQTYDETDKWGRTGSNFKEKNTSGLDVTKKIQTGWYSSSKTTPLTYKYYLEAGTYTLTAGFYEWWNGRSMKLALSGDGMTSVTSGTATLSGIGSTDVESVSFAVDTACTVTMEVQNATGGEAPVISWFAVAKGEVVIPEKSEPVEIIIDGADVDTAASNINGLTYKGFGLLSGNSTSNLLMDYKEESPKAYEQMLEVLFGGEHPLIDHIKMEMGNDGNNSTGADSCTMRFEDEEADASRSPGFQLAADAKAINPNLKVSFLRWEMPTWVSSAWSSDKTGAGYEAMYKWYKETIFDAYEKYGYIVDYVDPDKNETSNPDEDFIKWFKNRVTGETDFPEYMDEAAIEAYHNIKIIASDENTSLNIVPSMRSDEELYEAVDAIGFHYSTGSETSTADYRTMADVDDKEVWYSEGCATFSYTEYQENKTTDYGGGTIGGYQSPLALADNFIKSFVYSRKTHYIFQPAIGSFYEGAQYDHKELLSAREPWAGYVHYDPVIYMLWHFNKFAVTGWENEDNTAGIWRVIANASANGSSGTDHLKNESGNPSYMTLAAPDKSNFSVVMVNNSEKTLTYQIEAVDMNLADGAPMEIWETKTDSYLQYQGEADYGDGFYTVRVAPYSMVTATTLDCDGEEEYNERLPQETEKSVLDTDDAGQKSDSTNEVLYADDFEYSGYEEEYLENRGNEPRYIVDFSGAFAVEDGQLKQLLTQSVSQWNSNTPNCVVGDFRWMNYKTSVDVTVTGSGYAGLNIRQQTGMGFEGSGYNLRITKIGSWTLKKRSTTLSSGTVTANPEGTYNLALEGKGGLITAWIDGEEVASYEDSNPEYFGRVRLGCTWEETSFDNLVVEKITGYVPYATQLLDNASDEVSYTGTWDIIAGGGGSSNDWYRSTSTTSTADSSLNFSMTGTGFALLGANDGTGVLEVIVDGEKVAESASANSSNQHCVTYILAGLEDTTHEVTITVKSGELVLDAINFLASGTGETAIDPVTAVFDKYTSSSDYGDITVKLTLNGNTLTDIKNGNDSLIEGTDYTVSGSAILVSGTSSSKADREVTIAASYLKGLETGETVLAFYFSNGTEATLKITIADTAPEGEEEEAITVLARVENASELPLNGTARVNVTVLDQNQTEIALNLVTLSFESDNTSVASVDESGNLTLMGTGSATITVNAVYGELRASADVSIRVTGSTDSNGNGGVDPDTAVFDKYMDSENYGDITVNVDLNGNALTGIESGSSTLTLDTDYTVSGGVLITSGSAITVSGSAIEVSIFASYLEEQETGTMVLTFCFSNGTKAALTITITDTTPAEEEEDSAISPMTSKFNKYVKSSYYTDITVTMDLKGNTLTGIQNGTYTLVSGTDYMVNDNIVVIKKTYLKTLAKGTVSLTFEFSQGSDQYLSVKIVNTKPTKSSSSSKEEKEEERAATVAVGEGTSRTAAAEITVTRTTSSDGTKKDTVKLSEETAKETVDYALKTESTVAAINIADISGDSADSIEVLLPGASTALLGQNRIALNLQTGKAGLLLPWETVNGISGTDVSIRIAEVKEEEQIENTKKLLLQLAPKTNMLSTPISIVTNYSLRTKVTVPLDTTTIPSDTGKMAEFVSSLAVLVEHSDGEIRLQKGTVEYDETGNPIGLSIWVDKFSTFTLVETAFEGKIKVLKNTQMPDKELKVGFRAELDAKTVTEDNVYVLDSKGSRVEVTLECSGKEIKVIPISNYNLGETYTFYITGNVRYKTGSTIETPRKYIFTIGSIPL